MRIGTRTSAIRSSTIFPPKCCFRRNTRRSAAARLPPYASQEFLPGKINGKIGKHPALFDMARVKIDDALIAKDTTCVDTMDADGMVFSATPSGAWMPSVIAGDTGIPLTQRAQQFVLVPGNPNELAGRQAPARDPEPDHRDRATAARSWRSPPPAATIRNRR